MAAQPGNKGFQAGNKVAAGGRGPTRPDIFTQALISQLHEVDKKTSKEKIHILCEQLIKAGLSGEIAAIKEVIDRVQGKASQSIDLNANLSGVVAIEGGLPSKA